MKKILATTLLAACCFGTTACQSTTQYVSDSAVTLRVKENLAVNHNTTASKIHVDTADGIVTMSGVVSSEKERIAANEIARKSKGVKRVDNALRIQKEVKH